LLIEDVNEEAPAGGALATAGMKPLLRRLIMVGAALASVAVLVGAILLVLRLAQPPDYPLSGRNPDGEIVGRLAQVESGVVLVQPDAPGSSLVPLLLSKGTRVRIGSQEGWVGDLRPGGPVRVSYELYEGKRLAQTVEVPETEQARPAEAPATAAPAPKGPAPKAPSLMPSQAAAPPLTLPSPPREEGIAATVPAPAPKPAPLTTPSPQRGEGVAAPPKPAPAPVQAASPKPVAAPAPPPVAPAAAAAPAPLPRRTPPPAPVVRETPRPARPAAATAVTPPSPPPAREPARSRDDSTDGSAAVDWLLNNRR
jgi:hypothetical protein